MKAQTHALDNDAFQSSQQMFQSKILFDSCHAANLLYSKKRHNHVLLLQGAPGLSEGRLQWVLTRVASLEGRVLRLEASAAST